MAKNGRGHARTAALYQKDAVSIGLDSDISASLRSFADKIREQALRPAAAAAARVLYDEMKVRVPVFGGQVYVNKSGKRAGQPNATPGQLRDAIYRYHDPKKSNSNRQTYLVGINKRRAPHWSFVEFGTVNMAAKPFIRPAYDAKIAEAMQVGIARLAEKLKELSND